MAKCVQITRNSSHFMSSCYYKTLRISVVAVKSLSQKIVSWMGLKILDNKKESKI